MISNLWFFFLFFFWYKSLNNPQSNVINLWIFKWHYYQFACVYGLELIIINWRYCNVMQYHFIGFLSFVIFAIYKMNITHTIRNQPFYRHALCNNRICVYIFFRKFKIQIYLFFWSYDVRFILQQIVRTQNFKQRQKKTIIDWEKFLFVFSCIDEMVQLNMASLFLWNEFILHGRNYIYIFSILYIHKIKLRLCNFLRFTSLYFTLL